MKSEVVGKASEHRESNVRDFIIAVFFNSDSVALSRQSGWATNTSESAPDSLHISLALDTLISRARNSQSGVLVCAACAQGLEQINAAFSA